MNLINGTAWEKHWDDRFMDSEIALQLYNISMLAMAFIQFNWIYAATIDIFFLAVVMKNMLPSICNPVYDLILKAYIVYI